ncbi:MAG: phosphatidylinositol-4-phosphate 5-kinase, partial [Bacteroidales bacterium]|nr:phosphatidylinositol-4-phosphate 5-kinase [Candidatus Equimonas enterica]
MRHFTNTLLAACLLLGASSIGASAQKIQVGSHTFKDGSVYTGTLYNGKPNGKGKTVFPNG